MRFLQIINYEYKIIKSWLINNHDNIYKFVIKLLFKINQFSIDPHLQR